MTSVTVLGCPRAEDPFILDTDASDFAVGGVLSQVQDGQERPISFASKVLNPAQRDYCTTRKELLAVVVFTRHFRHYLLGRVFRIQTDHASLVWLMRFKHPSGQLAWWLMELGQYAFQIEHRSGTKHLNADGMSRIPVESACDCYVAGKDVESLPCRGCEYCRRVHSQWARFEDEVDAWCVSHCDIGHPWVSEKMIWTWLTCRLRCTREKCRDTLTVTEVCSPVRWPKPVYSQMVVEWFELFRQSQWPRVMQEQMADRFPTTWNSTPSRICETNRCGIQICSPCLCGWNIRLIMCHGMVSYGCRVQPPTTFGSTGPSWDGIMECYSISGTLAHGNHGC